MYSFIYNRERIIIALTFSYVCYTEKSSVQLRNDIYLCISKTTIALSWIYSLSIRKINLQLRTNIFKLTRLFPLCLYISISFLQSTLLFSVRYLRFKWTHRYSNFTYAASSLHFLIIWDRYAVYNSRYTCSFSDASLNSFETVFFRLFLH